MINHGNLTKTGRPSNPANAQFIFWCGLWEDERITSVPHLRSRTPQSSKCTSVQQWLYPPPGEHVVPHIWILLCGEEHCYILKNVRILPNIEMHSLKNASMATFNQRWLPLHMQYSILTIHQHIGTMTTLVIQGVWLRSVNVLVRSMRIDDNNRWHNWTSIGII